MRTMTVFARPPMGPVEALMEWTRAGLAEIRRILELYPGTNVGENESYRYLRVKMHAYTRLRRELRSRAHFGRTSLLRALRDFHLDPSDARGEGDDVLTLAHEKVRQIVALLRGFLSTGGPLPDPTWAI